MCRRDNEQRPADLLPCSLLLLELETSNSRIDAVSAMTPGLDVPADIVCASSAGEVSPSSRQCGKAPGLGQVGQDRDFISTVPKLRVNG